MIEGTTPSTETSTTGKPQHMGRVDSLKKLAHGIFCVGCVICMSVICTCKKQTEEIVEDLRVRGRSNAGYES